jgi:hypothetical protein
MRMRMLAMVLVVLGCGGGDGDGNDRSGPQPLTFGEACDVVVDAICSRGTECSETVNYDGCFQDGKYSCCAGDGTCLATYVQDVNVWTCAEALDAYSCANLDDGILPAACNMNL